MAFATVSLLNRYWRTYRRDDVHCRDLQVGWQRQISKTIRPRFSVWSKSRLPNCFDQFLCRQLRSSLTEQLVRFAAVLTDSANLAKRISFVLEVYSKLAVLSRFRLNLSKYSPNFEEKLKLA